MGDAHARILGERRRNRKQATNPGADHCGGHCGEKAVREQSYLVDSIRNSHGDIPSFKRLCSPDVWTIPNRGRLGIASARTSQASA
jgi:hypothetical protein